MADVIGLELHGQIKPNCTAEVLQELQPSIPIAKH